MDLRIVRNFLVGMTPACSRLGEVERCGDIKHIPRIGWVNLGLRYMPDKMVSRERLIAVLVREDADEKYIAKQFLKQIEDNIP